MPVKHVLSREHQIYFNKITELAVSMPDSVPFKEALMSLATDSGLHPLAPYFTCFIEDEVSRGLNDFQLLFSLMHLVWSLLQNPHIQVEPYLHQLMLPVVTCIVAKRLGNRIADNHWELRNFTAKLVATICKRFGHNYTSLQTRLTKTLLKSFLDQKRALTRHYGAVQGLAALGSHVRLLILPNLETYLKFLEEILDLCMICLRFSRFYPPHLQILFGRPNLGLLVQVKQINGRQMKRSWNNSLHQRR